MLAKGARAKYIGPVFGSERYFARPGDVGTIEQSAPDDSVFIVRFDRHRDGARKHTVQCRAAELEPVA